MVETITVNASAVASKKLDNLEGIQGLRFFAALMVVLAHATHFTSDRLGTPGISWVSGINGVDVFFVISGFVMVAFTRRTWGQPDAWKNFIQRRLMRIVPMYWLASTIKLMTVLLVPALVVHAKITVLHVISSYLFIPTTNAEGEYFPMLGVGWTLDYEMFFYVLFTLALFFRRNVYLWVGAVLGVAAILSIFRQPHMPAIAMYADTIVLEFFLGMLVAWFFTKKGPAMPVWTAITLAVVGFGLVLLPRSIYGGGIPQLFIIGIPSAALVLGTICLEPYIKGKLPRWVLLFGDASYVLYLFHPLISPAAPTIFRILHFSNFYACVAVSVVIALAAGVLVHLYIERPVTAILKTRLSRSRPNIAAATL